MSRHHTQSVFTTDIAAAVNTAGINAMLAHAQSDLKAAAIAFGCEEGLMKRLVAMADDQPSALTSLARLETPLFDIRIPMRAVETLQGGQFSLSGVHAALNITVVTAALKASASDASAVLGLDLPIDTATRLRGMRPEGVFALVGSSHTPFITPKFGLSFLEQIASERGVADQGTITLLASCIGTSKDAQPLQWRGAEAQGPYRSAGVLGRVDVRKAELCESIIALGGGKKSVAALMGSFSLTSIARQIVKTHRSQIDDECMAARSWPRCGLTRMTAGALALLITRLARCGVGITEATVWAFEYYRHALAPVIPAAATLSFRDVALNIAVPLSNRRAALAYSGVFQAVYVVAETRRGGCVVGTKEPHYTLQRRHSLLGRPSTTPRRRRAAQVSILA